MITRAQFAALALAMPEAVQASHFGKPDFRVRNKIFANLDSAVERGSLKVRSEIQELLVCARPQVFVPCAGAWGRSGWTYVMLEHVELDELRELVADAWRLVAPARLVARHAAPHAASAPGATTPARRELELSAVVSPRRKRPTRKAQPARARKPGARRP